MELQLQRHRPIGDALPGDVSIDGTPFSCTLERTSLAIAAGRYRVLFTVSARAARQELWSPDAQHRLPLIDGVPGRSGLRIHAANFAYELLGCIALGRRLVGPQLLNSRAAVEPFVNLIAETDAKGESIWIAIEDAGVHDVLT